MRAVRTVNSAAAVFLREADFDRSLGESFGGKAIRGDFDQIRERCDAALCTGLSHHAAAMQRATDSQPRVK